jgi:hypothetical protein
MARRHGRRRVLLLPSKGSPGRERVCGRRRAACGYASAAASGQVGSGVRLSRRHLISSAVASPRRPLDARRAHPRRLSGAGCAPHGWCSMISPKRSALAPSGRGPPVYQGIASPGSGAVLAYCVAVAITGARFLIEREVFLLVRRPQGLRTRACIAASVPAIASGRISVDIHLAGRWRAPERRYRPAAREAVRRFGWRRAGRA